MSLFINSPKLFTSVRLRISETVPLFFTQYLVNFKILVKCINAHIGPKLGDYLKVLFINYVILFGPPQTPRPLCHLVPN